MARQNQTPVQFQKTTRTDDSIVMTSGRAGKVVPLTYFPLLRGDSASGKVGVDIELAEMPRPLRNGVVANFQAWFVPKSAHPQFSGHDEFMASYHGEPIKTLGAADRTPPPFFFLADPGAGQPGQTFRDSEFAKTLGIHLPAAGKINTDLVDAFNLIYNFRLAAHSSRLTRRDYAQEDMAAATTLPRAFWPTGRFSRVVPDYERALIVGSLDLDVAAGQIPVTGSASLSSMYNNANNIPSNAAGPVQDKDGNIAPNGNYRQLMALEKGSGGVWPPEVGLHNLVAEMGGQSVGVTLADIDKARVTQSFAKLRTAYAGNDATGFDNDDAIVAELMQGFNVPSDDFKRPWLLDSKRVAVGFAERHATDAANLDASVSTGRASAQLSLNIPRNEAGGMVIVTCEVLPERLYEAQTDEYLMLDHVQWLPDALRDVQRPEPVDWVRSRRVDARHTTPDAVYGFEPMNDVWNRSSTRLGGAFYQTDPANPWTEQRSAIWQTGIVDPALTADHWLAPDDFPHDVFSDSLAPAFEALCRHSATIVGLTQFGDVLAENNDDYAALEANNEYE